MDNLLGGLATPSSSSSNKSPGTKRKVAPAPRPKIPPPPSFKCEIPSPPSIVRDEDVDMRDGAFEDTMEYGPAEYNNEESKTSELLSRKTSKSESPAPEEEDDDDDDDLAIKTLTGTKTSKRVNIISVKTSSIGISKVKPDAEPPLDEPKSDVPSDGIEAPSWPNIENHVQVFNDSLSGKSFNKENLSDSEGTLKFFWTDYYEAPDSLILFGKTKLNESDTYVSGCVQISGMCRDVYFLPRKFRRGTDDGDIDISDVYEEVSSMLSAKGIKEFRSKKSTRKYCFELPDIPKESEYLKVLLPFTDPQLPENLSGETFSHVFGTNTNQFEQFVLCRKVMGPCWLEIKYSDFNTAAANLSWCKFGTAVESPLDISVISDISLGTPPMTVMCLSIRTIMNTEQNKQEIVAISSRVYHEINHDTTVPAEQLNSFVFTVIRPPSKIFPAGINSEIERRAGSTTIVTQKSEQGLLNYFLTQMQKHDPDILVGHQLENVHLNILLHRLHDKNINLWHKIGRLKRPRWPTSFGKSTSLSGSRQIMAGRLLCDISNDLGKSMTTKCDSWSLSEMCNLYVQFYRQDIDIDASKFAGIEEAAGLVDFVLHNIQDTYFIAAIMFKIQILALSKQLTNLAGNAWARTLTGSRVDRNEFILLHEFTNQKYIVPDKESPHGNKRAYEPDEVEYGTVMTNNPSKSKYQGGLVFEPEKGLYKTIILVMDFNSLYPSIIQEFNICFTTVDRSQCQGIDDQPPEIPDSSVNPGIFPRLIKNLVERRREVKSFMKNPKATPTEKAQWDIRQQALKLTANSMYGCLGFKYSRFYALPLAMLTTYKGREILSNTKELAELNGLQVVYGDTDSVMINTNVTVYEDALKIGNEFKKKVNERYRLLEIDIDNIFQRLLLNAKKKYAALNMSEKQGKIETEIEVKGLDLKRREYSQLSKNASMYALNQILYEEQSDVALENIHDYLKTLAAKVRENQIPIQQYIIRNKLGKNPKDYPDGKKLPHVQVALRRLEAGEIVKADDVISYIITGAAGDDKKSPAERAYTIPEASKLGLSIDGEYYLLMQVLPPLERLCANVPGTDKVRLAECMGLDVKKHRIVDSSSVQEVDRYQQLETTIGDEERFKNAHRLMITCKCSHQFAFQGLQQNDEGVISASGVQCPSCKQKIAMTRINAQLEYAIRTEITNYYAGWIVCDEDLCQVRTRQIRVYGRACPGEQGNCRGTTSYEYTDKALYNQLLYYDALFNVDKAKALVGDSSRELAALAELNRERFKIPRQVVDKYLSNCGRRYVDMHSIFSFI